MISCGGGGIEIEIRLLGGIIMMVVMVVDRCGCFYSEYYVLLLFVIRLKDIYTEKENRLVCVRSFKEFKFTTITDG
jgi:hypothetical protein